MNTNHTAAPVSDTVAVTSGTSTVATGLCAHCDRIVVCQFNYAGALMWVHDNERMR